MLRNQIAQMFDGALSNFASTWQAVMATANMCNMTLCSLQATPSAAVNEKQQLATTLESRRIRQHVRPFCGGNQS